MVSSKDGELLSQPEILECQLGSFCEGGAKQSNQPKECSQNPIVLKKPEMGRGHTA
jgi:hypothetical protein